MNDAYGDPRNYDPNDQGFDENDFDPTWGMPVDNPYIAPSPIVPPPSQNVAPPPTSGGGARNPNAGPDGSTTPNMDPAGYMGGYWMNGQWVGGSPRTGAPRGEGEANPFEFGGDTGDFDPASYRWTQFNPTPYGGYGDFKENPFLAPDPEQTANDPWLQFALKQGTQQLENSAAYQGMVRSGMNKKNVLEHGVNFTRQFGNDVWNRAIQGWQANEDNRFRAWGGNRQNSLDTYNTNYRGQADSFAGVRGSETADFNARLQQWRDRLNAGTQIATAGLNP